MGVSAAVASAVVAGAGVAVSADTSRKARNAGKDRDAAAAAAVTDAANDSNARLAMRRRALSANSLATGASGMSGAGKSTLGG